ncbi:MAG: hypothetical protein QXK06_01635 [Candidatus Diapherotrites archaeon]
MERLEKIKSVFAIIRDALIIIFLIVLILAALTLINFFNSINPKNLSCASLVNTLLAGDLSAITGNPQPLVHYTPTQEMLNLMDEAEKAIASGNKQTALSKLTELSSLCASKEMPEVVQKISELKTAIEQENYVKALSLGSEIKKIFQKQV